MLICLYYAWFYIHRCSQDKKETLFISSQLSCTIGYGSNTFFPMCFQNLLDYSNTVATIQKPSALNYSIPPKVMLGCHGIPSQCIFFAHFHQNMILVLGFELRLVYCFQHGTHDIFQWCYQGWITGYVEYTRSLNIFSLMIWLKYNVRCDWQAGMKLPDWWVGLEVDQYVITKMKQLLD